MTKFISMIINLRNNLNNGNDSLDQFILDVLSGIEPEQALWDNRHGLGLPLYIRCLEIIHFCGVERRA